MSVFLGIVIAVLINRLATKVSANRVPFAPLSSYRRTRFWLLLLLTPLLFLATTRFSHLPTQASVAGFITLLLLLIVLDLEYKWVPHVLTGFGTLTGILLSPLMMTNSLMMSLWGTAVSCLLFTTLYFLGKKIFGHGAMGVGDITLATMSGAMLGLHQAIFALPAALLIGGILSGILLLTGQAKRGDHLPYGHYIAISTILFLLWGEPIFQWYTSL